MLWALLTLLIRRALGLIHMRKETDARLVEANQIIATRRSILDQAMLWIAVGSHLSTGCPANAFRCFFFFFFNRNQEEKHRNSHVATQLETSATSRAPRAHPAHPNPDPIVRTCIRIPDPWWILLCASRAGQSHRSPAAVHPPCTATCRTGRSCSMWEDKMIIPLLLILLDLPDIVSVRSQIRSLLFFASLHRAHDAQFDLQTR